MELFWPVTISAIILGIVIIMWLYPLYNVWASRQLGEANQAEAHGDQQVQVAKAKGRLQAAELNKKAEIIDAEAVAKSVEIIAKSLHNNQGYLQWKWIHMMENRDSKADTIYVPTEAGLPILEAMRKQKKK